MSRTENSSKQRSEASRASAAATGAIGSSPVDLAALQRLTPLIETRVHVGHEGVKMHAALERRFDRVEEQVHQHRLAAADCAKDVKAARRLGGLEPHQSSESVGPGLGPIIPELQAQRIELARKVRLRRVVFEAAV